MKIHNEADIQVMLERLQREFAATTSQARAARIKGDEVTPELAVSAMIVITLARSILDHVAWGIRCRLQPTPPPGAFSPYFPIFVPGGKYTEAAFRERVAREFPSLDTGPQFAAYYKRLMDKQHFSMPVGTTYKGIWHLHVLANESKHQRLPELGAIRERLRNFTLLEWEDLRAKDPEEHNRAAPIIRYDLVDSLSMCVEEATSAWLDCLKFLPDMPS